MTDVCKMCKKELFKACMCDSKDEEIYDLTAKLSVLEQEVGRLKGIIKVDDERLQKAGEQVGIIMGCDTPEWMADKILALEGERELYREGLDLIRTLTFSDQIDYEGHPHEVPHETLLQTIRQRVDQYLAATSPTSIKGKADVEISQGQWIDQTAIIHGLKAQLEVLKGKADAELSRLKKAEKSLDDQLTIQSAEPSVKTDGYMAGLLNGMLLAKANFGGEYNPVSYKDARADAVRGLVEALKAVEDDAGHGDGWVTIQVLNKVSLALANFHAIQREG